MIEINDRYLKTEEIKNDSTTISEVFAAQLVNDYISPNDVWNVGADTNLDLPDIYNDAQTYGFEVVRCEALVDFLHHDAIKELAKINYEYPKYLEIKSSNPDHVFNKVSLNMTIIDNRICATSPFGFGHSIDWMARDYRKAIQKKLKKLNDGNYKNCSNVSLIILNLARANGILNAGQIRKIYFEESQKFSLMFNHIYYVTMKGIYLIDTTECKKFKIFSKDEYNIAVKEMKQKLKIHEYRNGLQ